MALFSVSSFAPKDTPPWVRLATPQPPGSEAVNGQDAPTSNRLSDTLSSTSDPRTDVNMLVPTTTELNFY